MERNARFAEAIEKNELLNMLDTFHKQITGTPYYIQGDEWNVFRNKLCLSSRTCLIESRDPIWKEVE